MTRWTSGDTLAPPTEENPMSYEPPISPEAEQDEEVGTIEPPREPEPEPDEEVGTIEPPA